MPSPCIICNSEFKELAESLIIKGDSNTTIATMLQVKGLSVSHASVNRHKVKHMLEYKEQIELNDKGNRKYDREDSKNAFIIDADNIHNEVKNQVMHVTNYDELAEINMTTKLMLNRILNNQLVITIDLQEKYMKGETKYPYEQLRGLQIIQDMTQKFEDFARKNFIHYNKLVYSESGVRQYIMELGKKAKQDLSLIKPYVKGAIFSIMIDDTFDAYEKEYYPANPYAKSIFDKEDSFYDCFIKGIQLGMEHIERMDIVLYRVIEEICVDYELISEDDMTKLVNRFSKGKYDILKELNKYRKMLKDYEDLPDEVDDCET